MAMTGNPDYAPDFFMSVHQCVDCDTDPPDDIKRTCPFYHIRNDPHEQEYGIC